jgi:hypothetical protein
LRKSVFLGAGCESFADAVAKRLAWENLSLEKI